MYDWNSSEEWSTCIGVVQVCVMDDDYLVDIGVVQVDILKVLDELDPSYTICGLKILGVTTLCCHSSIQ